MSEIRELVIPMLQGIRSDIDLMRDDLANIKTRTTNIEEGMAATNRRLDNFDLRLDRIERRLQLTDA